MADRPEFTLGSVDEGHAANIDNLGSAKPHVAATARLNRDLVNVVEAWIRAEHKLGSADVSDLMIAAMHGLTTITGSVAVNLPKSERPQLLAQMRRQMIRLYDRMADAVSKAEET